MRRETKPRSKSIIRFQDCDPMGHLNNSRYIDYFINAREDQLLKYYDINVYQYIQERGRAWVVGKNEIIYKRPALLMENVIIETEVLNFSEKHILVEMRMYDEKETHVKSVMRSHFVPVDIKTQRSIPHEEYIMELLESVHSPNTQESIELRAIELQEELA
ncbi:MAG: acyl-CoA thioesterase [Schleiferiaceae bacterium]|jgi:acyl-CoA thioester hydrolase|nr:acyl-CoA thioesterase [Schleiferiaceae bacterium]